MPAVFVHGNPETPVIWDSLFAHLDRTEVIALHLPGFGRPTPDGFGATKEEYVDWLVGALRTVQAASGPSDPIDLVGHDWGGGFVMRAVATHPELVRSWACDVLGLFHPDYVWHDFAQIWQTPGAGEQYFEQNRAIPMADRVALYETLGIPRAVGEVMADAADDEMARCVLALYRSAIQPAMAEWGAELEPVTTRPGLAIIAGNDPFVSGDDLGRQVAQRLGARVHDLPDQGHWWMLGDPAAGAAMLTAFWATL